MMDIFMSARRALLSVEKASLTHGEGLWLILSSGNLRYFSLENFYMLLNSGAKC